MLIVIAVVLLVGSYLAFQHAGTPRFKTDGAVEEKPHDADCLAVSKGHCPSCRHDTMLQGPSGGMSMNIACETCLEEFNVHFGFGIGPFKVDRTGKMGAVRAAVFGITAEEYQANPNALISVH